MGNRRPQAPKRRNFVAKNVNKVHRPQTFRDRTKYNRYEDDLQDRLDDFLDGDTDEIDEEVEAQRKEEFKAKLAGKKHDPDMREEWENYLDAQFYEDNEPWGDYEDDYEDDYDVDFDYNGYDDYDY